MLTCGVIIKASICFFSPHTPNESNCVITKKIDCFYFPFEIWQNSRLITLARSRLIPSNMIKICPKIMHEHFCWMFSQSADSRHSFTFPHKGSHFHILDHVSIPISSKCRQSIDWDRNHRYFVQISGACVTIILGSTTVTATTTTTTTITTNPITNYPNSIGHSLTHSTTY